MGSIVSLAIGIATKYIPGLIGKAFSSDKAVEIASTVLNTAQEVTGILDPKEALESYDKSLAKSSEEQQKLADNVLSLVKLEVEDVQDAREHFTGDAATDRLTYFVMLGNLPLVGTCVGVLVWVTMMDLDGGKLTAISALIGGVIQQLLQERQQVMNYRFGSSIGEKVKNFTNSLKRK